MYRYCLLHLVALILAIAMPGARADEPAELVILAAGKTAAPSALFVGDRKNWRLPVTEPEFVSADKRVRLATSDEGLEVAFKGGREGQVYVATAPALDIGPWVAADGALVMMLRVDKAPQRQVALRMGCGFPCAANADVTRLLQALPEGEWLRVSFDLACFSERGLDTAAVDTPFLLLTSGKLAVTLGDIRLVPRLRDKATVKC